MKNLYFKKKLSALCKFKMQSCFPTNPNSTAPVLCLPVYRWKSNVHTMLYTYVHLQNTVYCFRVNRVSQTANRPWIDLIKGFVWHKTSKTDLTSDDIMFDAAVDKYSECLVSSMLDPLLQIARVEKPFRLLGSFSKTRAISPTLPVKVFELMAAITSLLNKKAALIRIWLRLL